jgi:hypothetical protein
MMPMSNSLTLAAPRSTGGQLATTSGSSTPRGDLKYLLTRGSRLRGPRPSHGTATTPRARTDPAQA